VKRATRGPDAEFGRGSIDGGEPTDLGCPDCRGVLTVQEASGYGLLTFRCGVGHTFSLESLMPLKEDQVEEALWSAVELYEELAMLHHYLAARSKAPSLVRREKSALALAKKLRAIVTMDRRAVIEIVQRRR
jgi:two-component system chemotaxis response regulator CheB